MTDQKDAEKPRGSRAFRKMLIGQEGAKAPRAPNGQNGIEQIGQGLGSHKSVKRPKGLKNAVVSACDRMSDKR